MSIIFYDKNMVPIDRFDKPSLSFKGKMFGLKPKFYDITVFGLMNNYLRMDLDYRAISDGLAVTTGSCILGNKFQCIIKSERVGSMHSRVNVFSVKTTRLKNKMLETKLRRRQRNALGKEFCSACGNKITSKSGHFSNKYGNNNPQGDLVCTGCFYENCDEYERGVGSSMILKTRDSKFIDFVKSDFFKNTEDSDKVSRAYIKKLEESLKE